MASIALPARLLSLVEQSLIRNGLYIFGVNTIPGLSGMIFWGIASRLYTPAEVGWGSAALSAAALVCGIAAPGIGLGIIRYLPGAKQPAAMIDNALTYTLVSSLLVISIYLAGIRIWSPDLESLAKTPVLLFSFVVFVVTSNLGTTLRGVSVARRKSEHALSYALFTSVVKLPLLLLFGLIGSTSILLSSSLASLAALFYYFARLLPKTEPEYRCRFSVSTDILSQLVPYSLTNYISTFIFQSYQFLLPLAIINILGPEANAYSYPALMMGAFIANPGISLAYSAFAEGSNHQTSTKRLMRGVTNVSLWVTVCIALATFVLAPFILLLFGQTYSQNSSWLLRLMALASPFMVINQVYVNFLRIKVRLRKLLVVSIELAVAILGVSVAAMPTLGANAVGYGLLAGNILVVLINARSIASMWGWGKPESSVIVPDTIQ